MKTTLTKKLCSVLLIVTILMSYSFTLPVSANSADDNAKPGVYLMQYEDDFTSSTANERISLGTNAVYGSGNVSTGGVANTNFKIYLNRNTGGAVGNIVTEFTVKQSGLMTYGGQGQILMYSSANERVGDLRWRKYNETTQDIYVNGTTKESFTFDADKSEIKVTMQYNTVSKEFSLWLDDEKKIDKSTTHTFSAGGDISFLSFTSTTQMTLSVEDFKWYYADPIDELKVQSTIYHEDFEADNASPESTSNITLGTSGVTYAVEKGALKLGTTATGGKNAVVININSDASPVTGEYVIEATLHNATGSENSHRFMIGSKLYVNWNPKMSALGLAYYYPNRTILTKPIADFGAKGNVLKITAKYNTDKGTVKLWFNDIEAWEFKYTDDVSAYTSISEIKMFLFSGSIEISDFHCYRPVPRTLTDEEKIEEAKEDLTQDKVFSLPLENGYITGDLLLPSSGEHDVAIAWSVSNNAKDLVNLQTGKVEQGAQEVEATLTATLTSGSETDTKDFTFKIHRLPTDAENVTEALTKLTPDDVFYSPLTQSGYLVDDLKLASKGANNTKIEWSISDNAKNLVDLETGYVNRGEAEVEAVLTAKVILGDVSESKNFNFKIPASGTSADGTPKFVSAVLREEFDGFNENTMTFTNGSVGLISVENGKLNISTSGSNSSAVRAYVDFKEGRIPISGEFAVDVLLEKDSSTDGPQIVLTNDTGSYLIDVRWYANNNVRLLYYNSEGTRVWNDYTAANYGISNKLKLTLKVDTDSGYMDMLLNNKMAANNIYNQRIDGVPLSRILFVKDNAVFSSQIERLCLYYTKTDDARAARLDAADLTYDSLIKPGEIMDKVIAYDFNLPTKGMRGSKIEWTSSHPDVVSSDGTVTRPQEDTQVTLSATVTSGEQKAFATISFTVLRGGEGDFIILKKDYDSITLESILTGSLTGSDLIDSNLNLYNEGKFGSHIAWTTDDASLIKADGTVTRPADENGNIYTTITATVTNGDYSLTKEFRLGVLPLTYTFTNIPLPERYEDVYKPEYSLHTEGWSSNSDQTSFSYEIDESSTCRGYGGTITEYDGYVEMIRERAHANSMRFIYNLQPSRQAVGDLAVVQYNLTKIGTGEIKQQIDNGSTHFYWQKDNTFRIRHRNVAGDITETFTKAYEGTVKITFMTDEKSGTISMWVNEDCVLYEQYPYGKTASLGLSKISTDIEGSNFLTLKLTEYDTFKSYPVAHKRPEQDKVWLTEELIRDGIPAPATGKLASNLNLVTEGKYGSTITWESSNEDYITSDGIVTRPPNWPQEEVVTLTAKISYGCFSVLKEFTFNVMPYYTQDETVAQKDDEFLNTDNWKFLTFNDTDFSSVTTSLNLPDKGPYGSTYLWKSSKPSVITESGRVIRPRWDGEAQTVTMTAVIVYGTAVRTKDFTFTVIPDEVLTDPKHMSDEDFFGVWDGSRWTTQGKFNYSYSPDLKKVEAAAKAGNYTLAKEELLTYMKNRPASFIANSPKRNSIYTEAFIMSGIRDSENHNHYASITNIASHDYKEHVLSLTNSIVKGAVTNYKLSARYNEKSTAYVLSSEYPNPDMRPRAEVTVNGVRRTYVACGDTTIRGGKYEYTNLSHQEEMMISNFGSFQGEGLSDLLLQFDFSDIQQTDDVTEAYLYIHAKVNEEFADGKELVICREGTDWNASTVTMRSINEYTFNYNGIPGKDTWRQPYNAESEYVLQSPRFRNHCNAAAEYAYTGDEKYAYTVIWDLMDFIIDTQGRFVYKEEVAAGRVPSSLDWEVLPNVERYGAYPRALDMGLKLESIVDMFDILKNSRYMTPDACTAILKNLWHGANELEIFLTDPVNEGLGANQKILEAECYSTAAAFMPEFMASDDLIKSSIDVMENLLEASFFSDGSYIEGSDGYTSMALDQFIQFWKKILVIGYDYSNEAKDLLSKATTYVANLGSNGGVSLAWGDNGKSHTRISMKGQDYYEITRDETINFINTYGRKGVMPKWTSQLYQGNMLAVMRSDWTDDGTYLFVPSSSFQTHGHADANSIILNAYKKALLIDPGYFNYDNSPERAYAKSTLGHNTVEIDNTSQHMVSGMGTSILKPLSKKNSWVSNSNYDFYSVTNYSNKAQAVDDKNKCVEHTRTITFLKPNIIIVSDLMSPDMEDSAEAAKPHSYKQLWHMSALAALDSNEDDRQFFSNFESGAQIKIASADTDATMVEADGIDTEAWGVASTARYGYYSKENIVGKETFDTVLLPYKNQGDVKAEHISLGSDVKNHDATAMKITVTLDNEVNYIYYMLDYDHVTGDVHTFGNYKTDAQLALVRTSEDGKVLETIIYNGSYINTKENAKILSAGANAESLSVTVEGESAEIYASNDVTMNNVSFKSDNTLKTIRYNDKNVKFENSTGTIRLPGGESDTVVENDQSSDKGGITDGKKPGGSQGGGGTVGGGTTTMPMFTDITNHWAKASIERMAQKGIVKGYGVTFRPDDSISRAELVTMAVRALGIDLKDGNSPFEDVSSDSWYAGYINTALSIGIISKDTKFRPDDLITREEMSKILSVANALMAGEDMVVPDSFTVSYKDTDEISTWAEGFVKYASYSGLMNGTDEGNFAPRANATRAQVATVIDRMFSSK
ncbi:MAG: S-layer homology domain-containing protein [Clostridia bacterium]|nr:S-layer homology domain-containing protein [Clostridia bacterium]